MGQIPWSSYQTAAQAASQAVNSVTAMAAPSGMISYNNAIAAAAIAAAAATSLLLTGTLEQAMQNQPQAQIYPPAGVSTSWLPQSR